VKLGRFDAVVWGVLGTLALALSGLVWAGDRVGARLTRTTPAEAGTVAAWGRLVMEFDQPMRGESVREHFRVEPPVSGRVESEGHLAWFIPDQAFEPGVRYTASLEAGAISQSSRATQETERWSFSVRAPWVVYVAPATGGPPELWRAPADGSGTPERLTQTGGKVFDFAISRDSEQIIYSAVNEQGGMDLWIMPTTAGPTAAGARLLVNCGADRCTVPAWSPDGQRVAFSREEVGLAPGAPHGPPRVWTVAVAAGTAAALYQDSQVLGYGPAWSPDGQRLAFFDGSAGGIRVLEIETSEEMVLSSWMGLVGSFSPDSQQMYFNDVRMLENQVSSALYLADFNTGDVSVPFGENAPWSDYGVPAWTPDGQWLALSLRDDSDSPGKQMWLMRPNGAEARAITSDPSYTHSAYRWNPWGTALVVQRVPLGTPFPKPELVVWSAVSGETQVVAVDGTLAQWMP
jgi:Tol biopolymer transport system component